MIKRRTFLTATVASLTALGTSAKSYARILGSHNRIRLAVIGLNGRGKDHIAGLASHIVALCDCDRMVLEAEANRRGLLALVDYREVLDRNDIDGVTIATPNHTHALIGIAALLAGKHVYVEKPVSHNVWEKHQLANAAQKTGLICQAGTQSRSSPSLQAAVEFVRS
ncbi:MAG TPA: Gfo/Idh/MocA family oxidoreductase, partial [Pirellulaceae bacterium]|nr:Gfo/Idh/MocA family oxidoreductase [Pirellulaceae bacterium]